jgi:hypothetical protein
MTSANGARVDEERIRVTKCWLRLLYMVETDPLGDALGQKRKERWIHRAGMVKQESELLGMRDTWENERNSDNNILGLISLIN